MPVNGDEERPHVEITPERVACSRHGEPFRARWPRGFPIFSVALFSEVIESADDPFNDADPSTVEGVTDINHQLDAVPLCERVSTSTLQRLYIESGIGREADCQICGERAMGTVYATRLPNGETKRWRHICFGCVLNRMEPMN